MRVAFRTRNFDLTENLRAHAERSIKNALGRLDRRIDTVAVRLGDLNGPRGRSTGQHRHPSHLEATPEGHRRAAPERPRARATNPAR